jgi:hypothetical protein
MNTEAPIIPCAKHPDSQIFSDTKRCVACTLEDAAVAPWPISTREEAEDGGFRKYWTGRVCANGHIKQRYAASGICIGCNSMNGRKRNKKARAKLIAKYRGLESVTVTVHPEDAQVIRDTAAVLTATRGL